MLQVEQQDGRWRLRFATSSTETDPTSAEPLEFTRSHGTNEQPAWVGGLVRDPAITQVAVTFGDGAREVVPVQNGAYLAAREAETDVIMVDGLDEAGRVIHSRP